MAEMPALAKGASSAAFRASHAATARAAAASKPKARRIPSPLDNQVRIPLPEGERTLTRRQLLVGAVGIGALIAVGAGAQAVSKSHEAANAVDTLEVPADAVASLSDGSYTALEGDAPLALAGEYKLPYGTLIWANCDSYAACLLPTEGADPLTQSGIVSLSDGAVSTVLPAPASSERGFDIYDIRCDERGVVWVEANCLSGEWRIYQAPHSKGAIGSATLADSGNADYDVPFIAAAGGRAFWQISPSEDGTKTSEASLLKSAAFGSTDVREDWRSNGRMGTPIYAMDKGVVITPRVDATGTYYQLTLIDAESGHMQDSLTLPAGMKPLEAGYVDGRFTFSFDAGYQNHGGLSSIGTYAPVDRGGAGGGSWFCFDRNPTAAPAWVGTYFVVKSTRTVSGVDLAAGTYFSLPCPDGCDDYGDYLASTGTSNSLVTYVAMPAVGDTEAHTLMRVWRA
ncbi:MAG: hypothetical protein Q4B69_01480 [Slackia sp.]|nr:hypothetical protein [Slackia sp.]